MSVSRFLASSLESFVSIFAVVNVCIAMLTGIFFGSDSSQNASVIGGLIGLVAGIVFDVFVFGFVCAILDMRTTLETIERTLLDDTRKETPPTVAEPFTDLPSFTANRDDDEY